MNTRRIGWLSAVICVLLLAAGSSAKELTVKEVVELKKLAVSDQEIIAEIIKTESRFNLTDDDVTTLKAAGAGEQLIRAMKNPPRKLTVADVAKMAADGRSAEEILDALLASPDRPKAMLGEIRDLKEKNVPVPVIVALKRTPLVVADLRAVAESKPKVVVYDKLAALLGFQKQEVSMDDTRSLMDAGVPSPIITKLREAAAAQASGTNKDPEPSQPPPDDPNPKELVGLWRGVASLDPLGDQPASLALKADGAHVLVIGSTSQPGTWQVNKDTKSIVIKPTGGSANSCPYTLDASGKRLIIQDGPVKLTLTRQRQ